jgi:hypothetical protein
MVVIVILSIFAGMMSLSVGGSENRRNTAFYERLTSNLDYVRLLSTERMQPYGLAIKLPQNDAPNQLVVVKLENAFTNSQSAVGNANTAITSQPAPPQWVIEKQIAPPSQCWAISHWLVTALEKKPVPYHLLCHRDTSY